jgi:hypothetical protein
MRSEKGDSPLFYTQDLRLNAVWNRMTGPNL